MSITSKGFLFSLELLFVFLACSIILVFCLKLESFALFEGSQNLKSLELEENALMVADFLVKGSDENNALFGSAFFDSEKHRVVPNLVSYSSLLSAKPAIFARFEVSELSLQRKNSKLESIFSISGFGIDCVAVQRFVLLKETLEKAVLRVVVCEK